MEVLIYLVPMALGLGLLGLIGFLWSLKSGQYDDLDGAAWRAIMDDDAHETPKDGSRQFVHLFCGTLSRMMATAETITNIDAELEKLQRREHQLRQDEITVELMKFTAGAKAIKASSSTQRGARTTYLVVERVFRVRRSLPSSTRVVASQANGGRFPVGIYQHTPEQVLDAAKYLGTPKEHIVKKAVPGSHVGLFIGTRTLKGALAQYRQMDCCYLPKS